MKELSIEEKAKRYDEAIERAKEINREHSKKGFKPSDDVLYIFPELKESEDESADEKVRKALIKLVTNHASMDLFIEYDIHLDEALSWLEKQGEQKSIKEHDVCEFCEDRYGCVSPCSMKLIEEQKPAEEYNITGIGSKHATGKLAEKIKELNEKTKELELLKQSEQKPFGQRDECLHCQFNYAGECKGFCAIKRSNRKPHKPTDKIEPKFKVGDWIVTSKNKVLQITSIEGTNYKFNNESHYWEICYCDEQCRLWTIQDAKDGDVLINWNNTTFIFKAIEDETIKFHIAYNEKWDAIKIPSTKLSHLGLPEPQFEFHPATKEQRDFLFQKIKNAGYEWDSEKKELKKIEEKKDIYNKLTAFEFSLKHIIEEAIECGDIHNLKADADLLLKIAQKTSWSEEDEDNVNKILCICDDFAKSFEISPASTKVIKEDVDKIDNWLKSLKERYTWRPSDEQMGVILSEVTAWTKGCPKQIVLESLYNDLLKLKE